jgi:hypothetical protein
MVASPEPSDFKVLRLSYVPDLLEEIKVAVQKKLVLWQDIENCQHWFEK